MKKFKLSTASTICSLCLVAMHIVKYSGVCFLFWGEPKYPMIEDYE